MSSKLGSSFHAGPVELVPSLRGRDKAKYLDRTFTLESSSGHRFRWRCDQRQCKARLITDFYGGGHMVYMFRAHDEDVHRLADSKQKSPLSTTYKQPPFKIGDYRYVLEKRIGPLQFWRCVHVSCPGRCRTHDDHLVSGPSEHMCSSLTEKPLPDKGEQSNNAPGVVARVGEDVPDIRAVTENSSRDLTTREQQGKGHDEPQRKRLKQEEEEEEEWRQILHKQQPRSRSPATNRRRVEMVDKSSTALTYTSPVTSKPLWPIFSSECDKRAVKPEDKDNFCEDDRSTLINSSSSDEGAVIFNAYTRESSKCRDDKKSSNKADEETTRVNARRVEKDVARTRFFANKAHGKRPGNVSGSVARVEHAMASAGRPEHSVAEWLQTPCSCSSSREKKLREDVLRQMRRLLEAETELVREMQGTEIALRGLLSRKIGAVPTAPAVPTVLTLSAI